MATTVLIRPLRPTHPRWSLPRQTIKIRFEGEPVYSPGWTMTVHVTDRTPDNGTLQGTASMSAGSPELTPGRRFKVLEARKEVAFGTVGAT